MEKTISNVDEIDCELGNIFSEVEIASGAVTILKEMVENMNKYPDIVAGEVKTGKAAMKLNSLVVLLDNSLANILDAEDRADYQLNNKGV